MSPKLSNAWLDWLQKQLQGAATTVADVGRAHLEQAHIDGFKAGVDHALAMLNEAIEGTKETMEREGES